MNLVQYIVLRKDLGNAWTKGANIAQACHALTKCLITFQEDELVKTYTSPSNIDSMRKIILQAEDESQLIEIRNNLVDGKIDHVEWIEQPENILTCIVLKPNYKDNIQKHLKNLCLYS